MSFNLKINKDGNGACPMCLKKEYCAIIKKFTDSMTNTYKEGDLEIVIYSCFKFEEKWNQHLSI